MRADVFAAFSTLLRQTRAGTSHHRGVAAAGSDSRPSVEEEPAVTMLKKQVQQSSSDVAYMRQVDESVSLVACVFCPGAADSEGAPPTAEGEEYEISAGLLLSPH